MRKKYNTPHRRHVVKTRMTDEEYADFTGRLAAYEISQSEFIRQAIRKATIRPIVTVSPVNDGLLAALSKLTAEYGKIGGNLNQIARSLNEYGSPYRGLEKEVRGAAADLAALKFEVLQKVLAAQATRPRGRPSDGWLSRYGSPLIPGRGCHMALSLLSRTGGHKKGAPAGTDAP